MIREPQFAHYPNNMKFPKPIQKQIKVVEGLTAIWAEEDAEYAVRQHALSLAKTADAEALKAAARAVSRESQALTSRHSGSIVLSSWRRRV